MEVGVEVALPAARLMGSAEGFGSGGNVGVRDVRRLTEGACSSGVQKDELRAVDVSTPAFWSKILDSELCLEACQSSSLHDGNASDDRGLGNMNSHSLTVDLDAKLVLQKSGGIVRNNSGCAKRSEMVQMEVSKNKPGLHDVNGLSPGLASSPASCNISVTDKTQMVKKKNSSTCRRGDRRNSKIHKNRCDSFSLKNGLVGFNSAAGGNNFFGIYGLKPDIFDITKYIDELSLDELLRGSYSNPSITKDRGKIATNSNINLFQSVRKACSLLQDHKLLQAQKCAANAIDNSCIRKVSTGLVTASSMAGQTDGDEGDCCTTDLPSSDKVQESGGKIKIKTSHCADSPLYHPKEMLERLALPPPKDFNSLLSDASKTTTSSKNCTDPRLGKPVSHRTGLPPFPWSHSFSGHNKLGADAVKLSNRTVCHGRWVKVKNSTALQKGFTDLLVDFESLTFNQRLVPVKSLSEHPENEFAPIEWVSSASGACSTSKAPADEHSPTYTAAQMLLDMATYSSKENPCATVKLLKKPSQMAMKACKLKAIERSDKLFDAPKSTVRPINPLKVGDDWFPSKKLRLSTGVANAYIDRTPPLSLRSPPRKLFRDSNAGRDSYGINLVKKSCTMKPPRGGDTSSSSQQKRRKSSQ